ncbi:MAG: hypothetical protein A3C58_02510 [Candidatus Staskawiczbacteria bacterium RIFCSPHIGHO2_02_FULL_34_10]|uniref:Uncharacterized protein n=2 Tax=Candidatus Staskawicziibacteriota TaxID=1817916 RepID=A0A1G2HLH4_9BACT|nr:MAG: hypothetical protein A2639_00195 [Candidatus Staskawiczbacteria bacterium RIFCSPHIGHO2_01_FULL_34_27]OGZ66555.1 MAG: hypothetical protein A3C58_02510 [Candidatus Staskawiczbacteria bacterium RIFCSPHIGHO2_02_FULL_34_10]
MQKYFFKTIILLSVVFVLTFGGAPFAKAENLTPSTAESLISILQTQIYNLKLQLINLQLDNLKQQFLAALPTISTTTPTITTAPPATGIIVVRKITIGGDSVFPFNSNANGYGSFTISSNANIGFYNLVVAPGTYIINEGVTAGWTKTGDTCLPSITVASGGTVSCTVTNTKSIVNNPVPTINNITPTPTTPITTETTTPLTGTTNPTPTSTTSPPPPTTTTTPLTTTPTPATTTPTQNQIPSNFSSTTPEVSTPITSLPTSVSSSILYGQTSPAVSYLQQALMQSGYFISAGATGFFGNQTVEALGKFQTDNKILVDPSLLGKIVGPKTYTAFAQYGFNFSAMDAENTSENTPESSSATTTPTVTPFSSAPAAAGPAPTPTATTSTTIPTTTPINNQTPRIDSVNPNSVTVGGPGRSYTVTGKGFVSSSVVWLNIEARTTIYYSVTELQVYIPYTDLITATTFYITVVNPVGVTSNAVSFTVSAVTTPPIIPPATPSTNNPVPIIIYIEPTTIEVGQYPNGLSLKVFCTNCDSSSIIKYDGLSRITSYNNGIFNNYLTTSISSWDITLAGIHKITIFNPAPVGGTSNAVFFNIENPTPVITSISPTSAITGSAVPITITINGTGFVSTSEVQIFGSSGWQKNNYIYDSSTKLKLIIPISELLNPKTIELRIFNPGLGGGTSNSINFPVLAVNPVPNITSISPQSIGRGGPDLNLAVYGNNFATNSIVRFDGQNKSTKDITIISNSGGSTNSLSAIILASDLLTNGTHNITIFNPGPGGGTSNSVVLTVTNTNATTGTLIVNKNTVNEDDTFAFDVRGGLTGNVDFLNTKMQIETINNVGSTGSIILYSGVYDVEEFTDSRRWIVTSSSCNIAGGGTTGTFDLNKTLRGFNIESNSTVTCTFNNTYDYGTTSNLNNNPTPSPTIITNPTASIPVTSVSPTTNNYKISFGQTNNGVGNLQMVLIAIGLLDVDPTGYFGFATSTALSTLQTTTFGLSSTNPNNGKNAGPWTQTMMRQTYNVDIQDNTQAKVFFEQASTTTESFGPGQSTPAGSSAQGSSRVTNICERHFPVPGVRWSCETVEFFGAECTQLNSSKEEPTKFVRGTNCDGSKTKSDAPCPLGYKCANKSDTSYQCTALGRSEPSIFKIGQCQNSSKSKQ